MNKKEDINIEKQKLEKAAYILKTIAHPTRLAVILLLEQKKELSVNELATLLDCEQSLLSHHLTNMKIKGLLQTQKKGIHVYYSLREKNLLKLMRCIEKCDCNM